MIAALFALALAGASRETQVLPAADQVGPIHLGESVAAVRKALGPGWRGTTCLAEPSGRFCMNVVVYTDGVDQLEVRLVRDTELNTDTVAEIDARENRGQGGKLNFRVLLRRWHWIGGTLFEMPASIPGWSSNRNVGDDIASYRYHHALGVWFTKNQWHGVDFHMFSE